MPKFVVLKALPQGQQPGETVDLNEDEGRVFLLVGAVKPADEKPKPTRRYARRDMQAEDEPSTV